MVPPKGPSGVVKAGDPFRTAPKLPLIKMGQMKRTISTHNVRSVTLTMPSGMDAYIKIEQELECGEAAISVVVQTATRPQFSPDRGRA
jgi:hypothetical protein